MSARSDEVDMLLVFYGLPPRPSADVLTWSREAVARCEAVEALRSTPEPLQTFTDVAVGSLRWEAMRRVRRPPDP